MPLAINVSAREVMVRLGGQEPAKLDEWTQTGFGRRHRGPGSTAQMSPGDRERCWLRWLDVSPGLNSVE